MLSHLIAVSAVFCWLQWCFSSLLPGQNKDLNQKWQQQVKYCECIFNLEKPSLRTSFYMFLSQNKLQGIWMHLLFPPGCSGLLISFCNICVCVYMYVCAYTYTFIHMDAYLFSLVFFISVWLKWLFYRLGSALKKSVHIIKKLISRT